MESTHPTVRRIDQARDFRRITDLVLADMIDRKVEALRRMLGDREIAIPEELIERMAWALNVTVEWLRATTEEQARQHAPRWSRGMPMPPPRTNEMRSNDARLAYSELGSHWTERLESRWRGYLARERADGLLDRLAPGGIRTADGKEWRLFHRSEVLRPLSGVLTPAQQHALAIALNVPNLPTYEEVVTEALAAEAHGAAFAESKARELSALLDTNPLFALHLDPMSVGVDMLPWPLAADGETYARLTRTIEGEITRRTDLTPDRDQGERDVGHLLDWLHRLYVTRFPDDPQQTIGDAVRTYRAYRRSLAVNLSESELRHRIGLPLHVPVAWMHVVQGTGKGEPLSSDEEIDAWRAAYEVWMSIEDGRILTEQQLQDRYEAAGLTAHLDQHLVYLEKLRLVLVLKRDGNRWVLQYDPRERPDGNGAV